MFAINKYFFIWNKFLNCMYNSFKYNSSAAQLN